MPKTGFHNRENQSVSEDLTMIKSMTGFGHAEMANDSCRITVEMKSVNNRYLDISIRMPRQLNALEGEIKKELKKYMQRGKVDVFISYEDLTDKARSVQYNRKLAEEYLRHLRQMAEDFGIPNDINVSQLSRYPDVLTMEEETADADTIWANLRGVLDKAAESFLQARIREGEFLKADILSKLDEMTGDVEFITSRSPEIIAVYRQKLYDKVWASRPSLWRPTTERAAPRRTRSTFWPWRRSTPPAPCFSACPGIWTVPMGSRRKR